MKLTFEITVSSPETYLAILGVLDAAVADGKIDVEFSVKPTLSALPALAAHAYCISISSQPTSM